MKTDVTVIGGGILGAAAAYKLAGAGFSTALLERRDLAGGASGVNLGQISVVDRIEPWHMPLALASIQEYQKLAETADMEFMQSGGTVVIADAEDLEAAKERAALLREYGVECTFHYGSEITAVQPMAAPDSMRAVMHCPMEGTLNPLKTVMAFADLAAGQGARVLTHTDVKGFERENGRITKVLTDRGEIGTSWVVNCAGAWAGQIGKMAGISIPMTWKRGTAFVSVPGPQTVVGQVSCTMVVSKKPVPDTDQLITAGMSQTQSGSIVLSQSHELSDLESRTPTMSGVSRVARQLLRQFPQLAELEIVRIWAAVTPATLDKRPFYGFCPQAENMLTAAGFKGAFTTAPAIAEKIVESLSGVSRWDISAFRPDRTT
jgi:sarcosine oxidase subunit beta